MNYVCPNLFLTQLTLYCDKQLNKIPEKRREKYLLNIVVVNKPVYACSKIIHSHTSVDQCFYEYERF